jgi:uncharacterized protein
MSIDVLDQAIRRIREHVLAHDLKSISIIFHGGEPLLAGKKFFEYAVPEIKRSLGKVCTVKFGMQSNGVLLDDGWAELLLRLKIGVGISIDGYRDLNDQHRLDHRGQSTYHQVVNAIKILSEPEYAEIKGGLLCVIQPDSDPVELLNWFRRFGRIPVDFLFPHFNHERTPPSAFDQNHGYGYGLWLSRVFDHWWGNDVHEIKIRTFEDLMHLMIGGRHAVESYGLSAVQLAVVQTDGAYEAVDSLKSTYDGAVSTAKNIFADSFNDILGEHLVASRFERFENLSETCQHCRLVKACGGGYVPHRYHPALGFNSPTVYCRDLMFLIEHIEARLSVRLDEEMRERMQLNLTAIPALFPDREPVVLSGIADVEA